MKWKTVTLSVALAAAGAALAPRPAEALPSSEVYRYYYSDATMTTVVGELFVMSCYGSVNVLDGVKTAYVKMVSEPCNGGSPPPPKCYVHGIEVPCNYF